MLIKIKADDDFIKDPLDLEIHNENLDNYNFVELSCNHHDEKTNEDINFSITVSVQDLYEASKLFNNIRLESIKERQREERSNYC